MHSVASVSSAGGAANYLASDNYYANDDPAQTSEWGGEGAAALGLTKDEATTSTGERDPDEPEQKNDTDASAATSSEAEEENSAEGEKGEGGGTASGPGKSEEGLGAAGEASAGGAAGAQAVGGSSRAGEMDPGKTDQQPTPEASESGHPGVDKQVFEAILKGRLPNGTQVGDPEKRAIGMDMTFSAPKSVSMLALVAGDKRVAAAHATAVKATMGWAERNLAEGRRDIGGRKVPIRTGNLVYAMFGHDTSRALDPQLHTHVVVANMTRMPDGKWQALHNGQLWRNNTVLGSIYHAALRKELEKLGYQVDTPGKHGTFEVKGVTRDQIEGLSVRRQDILAKGREIAARTPQALRAITTRTRDPKIAVQDRPALSEVWRDKAVALGFDGARLVQQAGDRAARGDTPLGRGTEAIGRAVAQIRELMGVKQDPLVDGRFSRAGQSAEAVRAQYAVASAVRMLSEREAAFGTHQLTKTALDLNLPGVDATSVEARVEKLVARGDLVPGVARDDGTRTMLTTPRALAVENAILAAVERGRGRGQALADPADAHARLEIAAGDRTLNAGQEAAAALIVASTGRIVAVQGVAGAGKSTMLSAVASIARDEGVRAIGLAFQNKMVSDLRESTGLPSMTVHALLYEVDKRLAEPGGLEAARKEWSGSYWLLDEASMVSNEQMLSLTRAAEKLEVGRLAIVGDRQQLAAIDAGKSFALMQEGGAPLARMDENLRQRTDELRLVAALANRGEAGQALRALGEKVIEAPDADSAGKGRPGRGRIAAAAEIWLGLDVTGRDDTQLFTSGRELRAELNHAIQDGLRAEGTLSGAGHELTVLERVNTTREELRHVQTYRPGQLLEIRGRVAALGLERGIHQVLGADKTHVEIGVNGKRVRFRPDRLPTNEKELAKLGLVVENRLELHEGDKIRWTANDKKRGLDNSALGRVLAIEQGGITVERADGTATLLKHGDPMLRRLDLAYALNMHMAQGITADRGIVVMGAGERQLTNQRLFNVAVTRVRDDLTVVTDDKERLGRQLDANPGNKTSALEETGRLIVDQARERGAAMKDFTGRPNDPQAMISERANNLARAEAFNKLANELLSKGAKPISEPMQVPERQRGLSL